MTPPDPVRFPSDDARWLAASSDASSEGGDDGAQDVRRLGLRARLRRWLDQGIGQRAPADIGLPATSASLAQALDRCRRLESELAVARSALAALSAPPEADGRSSQADVLPPRHLPTPVRRADGPGRLPALPEDAPASAGAALAVLYLDLDDLEPIDAAHGTTVREALVRVIAARLGRAVRADDQVNRDGDRAFACLLRGRPGHLQLSSLACKLFDAVSAPVRLGGLRLTVRPSIGIAAGPADGTTTETLMARAAVARHRARRQQTGFAFFDPSPASRLESVAVQHPAGHGPDRREVPELSYASAKAHRLS